MKKSFVLILVAFITLPAFSQIKFGIKAGVGTTTVPTYNFGTGAYNIEALKTASYGFHGGVFLRITVWKIYIQPEALLATNSYSYNVQQGTNPKELIKQNFNKLDIPVMAGIKLGPVRLNVGPVATVQIGSPKALINDPSFSDMYKGATFGYQAGAGFDLFKKLTFDVRYEGSLSGKFGDAVSIGGQSFKLDSRQPSVLLSIGWMF